MELRSGKGLDTALDGVLFGEQGTGLYCLEQGMQEYGRKQKLCQVRVWLRLEELRT